MKSTILKLTTQINAPIERVFDLSRSIDLHIISTRQTNEEAIAGVTSGLIGLGESVTWQARHFGMRQTLTTKITGFDRPNHFTDEMVQGAFKSIRHEHYFAEKGGITTMKDIFVYEVPFGIAGRLFNRMLLKNHMTTLLTQRNRVIKTVAEGSDWRKVLPDL